MIAFPTPLTGRHPRSELRAGVGSCVGRTCHARLHRHPRVTPRIREPLKKCSGHCSRRAVDSVPPGTFFSGTRPKRIDPETRTGGSRTLPKWFRGLIGFAGQSPRLLLKHRRRDSNGFLTKVAEMTKLLENTFRHVNIALVNELAMFAHDSGSTSGRRSTPPRRNRSASCGSPGSRRGRALPADRPSYLSWQVKRTAGSNSGSSSSPTTSTTTCPNTSFTGSPWA